MCYGLRDVFSPTRMMISSPTHIHLVRHGQVDNPQDVVYGRLPGFGLSEQGLLQARSAAVFLGRRPLAAIYSSPLLRARQTANALQGASDQATIHLSSLITEVASPFEGRPSTEADALGGDVYTGAGPEFEQPEDILNRALQFLRRMTIRHGGRHVAAVTHGDVITFVLLWAKDHPLQPKYKGRLGPLGIRRGYPAHGSVTTFTVDANDMGVSRRPAIGSRRDKSVSIKFPP